MRYEAVIFDLGNTLVSYYSRAQWPGVLAQAVEEVAAYLRSRNQLRIQADEIAQRVEAERGEQYLH